jgi:hypothetical protein
MLRAGGVTCWHNGATFGFSSYLSLDRNRRAGIVLLSQTSAPQLVTALGGKLERLLAGQPTEPLKGEYGRTLAWVLDPVRILLAPFGPLFNPLAHGLALLPMWLRLPVGGAVGYGVGKLIELALSLAKHLLHH